MSPIIMNPIDRKRRCIKCNKEFSIEDHVKYIPGFKSLEDLQTEYGDQLIKVLESICPDCLKDIIHRQLHRTTRDYFPNLTVSKESVLKEVMNVDVTYRHSPIPKILFGLFAFLAVFSIIAITYSLTSKLLPLNLPNFPFNVYILIHITISFFIAQF